MSKLRDNAINSIRVGFKAYLECDDMYINSMDLLSAIRNIHAGFYLLLKSEIEARAPKGKAELLLAESHKMKIFKGKLIFEPENNMTVGAAQILERLNLVGIVPKFQKRDLVKLNQLRNAIEHKHPVIGVDTHEAEVFETWIIKAFHYIYGFNKQFTKLKPKILFGNNVCEEILHRKENNELINKMLTSDNPVEPEIDDKYKLNDLLKNRVKLFMHEDDEEDEEISLKSVLPYASCTSCGSSRLEPLTKPRGNKFQFSINCLTCENKFMFAKVAPEIIIRYFEDETRKALYKDGCFPIAKCKSCKSNAYLNYSNLCLICGSTQKPEYLSHIDILNIHNPG